MNKIALAATIVNMNFLLIIVTME